MPTNASAAITILAVLRTNQSWVVTELTFMAGWWICTAIKMAPATAALMPADRVSLEGVIDMVGSFVLSGEVSDAVVDGTKGCGDADITR